MTITELARSPDAAELWAEVKRLRRERQIPATLPILERLCAEQPAELRFMVGLAEALAASGRTPEATVWLERARQLDPQDPRPAEVLAKLSGQSAVAAPDSPELQAARAELNRTLDTLEARGEPEALIAAYHAAVRDQPAAVADIEAWAPRINAAGRALYRRNDERPSPWAQEAIREVHERGIAIRPYEEVFGESGLLGELQDVVRATTDWTVPGKPHFFKAIQEGEAKASHPVMQAGLHHRVGRLRLALLDRLEEMRLAGDGPVGGRPHNVLQLAQQAGLAEHLLVRPDGDAPLVDLADRFLRPGGGPFVVAAIKRPAGCVDPRRPGLDVGDRGRLVPHGCVVGGDQRLRLAARLQRVERSVQFRPRGLELGRVRGRHSRLAGELGEHLGGAGILRIQLPGALEPYRRLGCPAAGGQGLGQADHEPELRRLLGAQPLKDGQGGGDLPLAPEPLHLRPELGCVRGTGEFSDGHPSLLSLASMARGYMPRVRRPSPAYASMAAWASSHSRKATILGERRRSLG